MEDGVESAKAFLVPCNISNLASGIIECINIVSSALQGIIFVQPAIKIVHEDNSERKSSTSCLPLHRHRRSY